MTCARIERWLLRMQPYRFTVKYIPGPKNIADSLSRLLCVMPPSEHKDQTEEYVKWVAQESTPVSLTTREIERASELDPELKSVRECLLNGKWHALEFKEYLPVRGELSAIVKLVLRGTRIVIPKQLRCQVQEFSIEDEVRDRYSERKEKGNVYADCRRNARESEIREGDKVLLRQKKENKLSTPYKQSPFTVIQQNSNSVVVEADGVQYRRNVTHVKKYFERDYAVLPATSKSTDDSEAQRATQSLSNQESREPVNVSSERASEDDPLEYTRSDDATMEQRNCVTLRPGRVKRLPSKFQDYVLSFIQLDSE